MKRQSLLLIMFLCFTTMVNAQVPQMFSYQAVLRNGGEVIKSSDVTIKASLLAESTDGTTVYAETHETTTSAQGVVALKIGAGNPTTGQFSLIPWENDIFLKIEVKIGSNDYVEMGTSQILSVPYSIRAERAAFADSAAFANSAAKAKTLENGMIEIAPSAGHNAIDPIFAVKNTSGDLVFAVYEDGVRSYVNGFDANNMGGFVVGGLSDGNPDFFVVSPDSTRVYVDDASKGPRSGFAVGGRAGQKGYAQTYFNVTPAFTEVYFDTTAARGPRSGFAVGGRAGQKSSTETYLAVTPNLTEVYFDNSGSGKGPRSGFAVGGRAGQKSETSTYLEVTPSLTSVYIDENANKGPRSGFAVGGRAGQKGITNDILFVSTDSTRVYIDDGSKRGPRSGFAVGGRAGQKNTGLSYLNVTADSTRIVVGNPTTKSSEVGGFTVGGYASDGNYKSFLQVTENSAVFNTDIHSQGNLLVGGTVSENMASALDSITDIEGNKYGTVIIGNQTWMTQNLRTLTYNDGTPISDTLAILAVNNPEIFGAYYRWYAVESQKICPTGWHVADGSDWTTLLLGIGGQEIIEDDVVAYFEATQEILAPNSDWAFDYQISNSTGLSVYNAGMSLFVQNQWIVQPSAQAQTILWASPNNQLSYPQQIIVTSSSVIMSPLDTNDSDNIQGFNIRCVKD